VWHSPFFLKSNPSESFPKRTRSEAWNVAPELSLTKSEWMAYMLNFPSSREWYAFRVRPRHEKSVSTLLRSKCFNEFLPLLKTNSRWADRVATIERPLFPGYIFCEVERHHVSSVRSTPGVFDVVRAGSSPLPARRDEVESLLHAVRHNLPIEPCNFEGYRGGEWLRITAGPLSGLCGTLVRVRGEDRLLISIELLHRQVLVEMQAASVELARQRMLQAS
jgi:transcription antitermination factor NusG